MALYLNPEGHNWGPMNLDGYGISIVLFAGIYSLVFLAACGYLWTLRKHTVLKMRKVNLTILSLLVLHVYLFMIFMVYPLNGAFPCSVEYWTMCIYLPIGVGLFQAHNQQLLLVSHDQVQLLNTGEMYKPIGTSHRGLKGFLYRFKIWWDESSAQGKYERYVAIGIAFQFIVSTIIYCVSRKWHKYGVVSHDTTPGLCRRGWEWAPSVVWQFMWNFVFGPLLLWKMRGIRDIYRWRLQTTVSILAGLPGSPLWLAAVYSDKLSSINKYWVPAMWLVPGLMTMQIVTLIFPILQVQIHEKYAKKTEQLEVNERIAQATITRGGFVPANRDVCANRCKMYSLADLQHCLRHSDKSRKLQDYATSTELNGENIIFMIKVHEFVVRWQHLHPAPGASEGRPKVMKHMYRVALSIFLSLVYSATATYPVNLESRQSYYLECLFGDAAKVVASCRPGSFQSPRHLATPWDDPIEPTAWSPVSGFEMGRMSGGLPPTKPTAVERTESPSPSDPLTGFVVPEAFNANVFDDAFTSVEHLVWTTTWQRYCQWRESDNTAGFAVDEAAAAASCETVDTIDRAV